MGEKKFKIPEGKAEQVKPAPADKPEQLKAHRQADKDIGQDADLNNKPGPEDDLDEGELARAEAGDR
jgi:hypothetical protein